MDGAQTLLGKPICFAHENSDGKITHTYGVVVHVTWDEKNLQGVFNVATNKGAPLIRVVSKTVTMVMVSLVNFCLRPMHNKAVMLFRRPMMIRSHLELDEAWDKIAKNAKRSTTATTNKILSAMPSGATMPDESTLLPVYNFEQGVIWLPVSRILDHSFYVLNGRSGKKLPESLFEALPVSVATAPTGLDDETLVTPKRGRSKSHDEPLTQPSQNKGKSKLVARKVVQFHSPVAQRAQKVLDESLLSEFESGEDDEDLQDPMSDEDEDGLTGGFSSIGFAGMNEGTPLRGGKRESFNKAAPPTKRVRGNGVSVPTSKISAHFPKLGADTELSKLSNQHAGFQRLVDAIADPDKVSRSIKLGAAHATIYSNISTGKCANGAVVTSAQDFAESFQSMDFGFTWYPFMCVGMLTFDFNRSLSITMFQYEEWFTVAKRTNTIDMSDFGRKAKTVPAPVLTTISQLVGCVGQLLWICQVVYAAPLVKAVDTLRAFLMTQECMEADMGPEPVWSFG